jgi:hypothetical protein
LEELTTHKRVGVISNVKAALILRERHQLRQAAFVKLKIWHVAPPVRGSTHSYKYSLAYIVAGDCVLRYDN